MLTTEQSLAIQPYSLKSFPEHLTPVLFCPPLIKTSIPDAGQLHLSVVLHPKLAAFKGERHVAFGILGL